MTGPGSLPDGSLVHSRVVSDPGEALAAALDRSLTGYAVLEPQDALLLDADGTGVIAFRDGVPVAAHHAGTGRGGPEALADLAAPGPYSAELRTTDGGPPPALADRPDRRVPPGMPAERLAGDQALADRTRDAGRGPAATDTDRRPAADADGPREGARPGGDHPDPGGRPATDETGRPAGGPESPSTRRGSGTRHDDAGSGRATAREGVPREPPAEDRSTEPRRSDAPEGADAVAAFLDDERKIEAIREQASRQARQRADEWGLTDQLSDDSPDGG